MLIHVSHFCLIITIPRLTGGEVVEQRPIDFFFFFLGGGHFKRFFLQLYGVLEMVCVRACVRVCMCVCVF